MEKTIKLVSVLLKCGLGSGGADDKKKINGRTLANLLLLLCLLPVLYYLFRGGVFIQRVFGGIDGGGSILGFLLFVVSIVISGTGIAACINSFYLSSNLNSLLVMPFTAGQITGAKFIVAALYEYGISLTVLFPVLAGFGYAAKAPAGYWVGMVLAVLLVPLVPLVYSALAAMIVMRFLGRAKNKERTTALGAIGLFLLTGFYNVIRNVTGGMKLTDIEAVVEHLAETLKRLNMIFPDIPFLLRVMIKQDMLSILWLCTVVAAAMLVFRLIAGCLYLSGAVGLQETSASHKKMSERQLRKENQHVGIVRSYTRKELRTVLRTPAYYMSCLFLTLGWPLILVLPFFFSEAEKSEALSIEKLLLGSESTAYYIFLLFCIVFAVTSFVASLNGIAVTSISREGKSFLAMKQIPVSLKKQLKAKRNAALVVCWIGSGGYMLIGIVLLIILKGLPWWSVIPILIFNLLLLYIIVDLEMIYGLLNPNLSWEGEEQVAHSGRIGFVLFLIGIVLECILVFGISGRVKALTCRPWIFMSAVCGILLAVAVLIDQVFYLYGERRLQKLE